jgi:hypothetical protein
LNRSPGEVDSKINDELGQHILTVEHFKLQASGSSGLRLEEKQGKGAICVLVGNKPLPNTVQSVS